ncbi:MAG: SDR family oxidoreductase [Chloroflexi bacterium]|nr:SDR family oxidoreductase [Chloroflexota bacterium]
MILVTGATGNVASLLVPALLKSGESIRALVRDESKAQSLRELGAEVVVADMEQADTLGPALDGVDRVYLISDNGPTGAKQAINVIEAAKQAGSPHIVRQTAYGTPKSRIIKQHEEVKQALTQSGLPYTFVEPTFFMQNTMMAASTIASDGVIYWDMDDARLGMVDIRDVAEVAAKVLTSSGHEGKSYVLTGPASISFNDVASALSRATGREISYVSVPSEASRAAMVGMGIPEWIADGFVELSGGFREGFADLTTDNVEQVTGHAPISIGTFATDFAQVFGATG